MPAVSPPPPTRSPADRCPGALRPHPAADGALVRVRLPGGQIDPAGLRALAAAARRSGDGRLELTARGNLQIRGLTAAGAVGAVADQCAGVGLLPSATHERVRNILGSPLSGRDGLGAADIRPWVYRLDVAVCADPALAALPGRFLFALDDGRGDVTGHGADVAWQAGTEALLLAGRDTGLRVTGDRVVRAMLAAAREFLDQGGGAGEVWRVSDLDAGAGRIVAALVAREWADQVRVAGVPAPPAPAPGVGLRTAGAQPCAVLAVPLGRLSAAQAALLADIADGADGGVVVTPWRSVVVDLAPVDPRGQLRRLTGAGLVADPGSPWVGLSACAGVTGCASALADVRADATALAGEPVPAASRPHAGLAQAGGAVHWAGCERRCGQPAGRALVAVATGAGYRMHPPAGAPTTVDSSAAARAFAAAWRDRNAA